jgi:hypothetical protein
LIFSFTCTQETKIFVKTSFNGKIVLQNGKLATDDMGNIGRVVHHQTAMTYYSYNQHNHLKARKQEQTLLEDKELSPPHEVVFSLSGLYKAIIKIYIQTNFQKSNKINFACKSKHSLFAHKFLEKKEHFAWPR